MNRNEIDMKKILEKIKKLRRHAQSAYKIGSIAEAETATLLMNRLLTKYNNLARKINREDDKKTVKTSFQISMDAYCDAIRIINRYDIPYAEKVRLIKEIRCILIK
jgi:hypothetical protein